MRDDKPADHGGPAWFNWPFAVGLAVNVLVWGAVVAWWLLIRRH